MDKLEYDLQVSGVYREDDSLVVDISQKEAPKNEEQTKAIEVSSKVVSLLQEKLKAHNQEFSKRVKLYQLRKAFCRGAQMYDKDQEPILIEWGLARVNLFLRISSGKIDDINLELDKSDSYNSLMDIANHFTPSEKDFKQASLDIKSHDLDCHFESVDELYIEEKSKFSYYIGWKD